MFCCCCGCSQHFLRLYYSYSICHKIRRSTRAQWKCGHIDEGDLMKEAKSTQTNKHTSQMLEQDETSDLYFTYLVWKQFKHRIGCAGVNGFSKTKSQSKYVPTFTNQWNVHEECKQFPISLVHISFFFFDFDEMKSGGIRSP